MDVKFKERAQRALKLQFDNTSIGNTTEELPLDADVIPEETRQFMEKHRKNKEKLLEIVKAMKQVVEKWDMKQQSFNMVPKQDVELTYPHKCAEELGRLHKVASTVPGSLNEVLSASQVAYEDLATLEREHSSKLNDKVIERVFRHFLYNEAPAIDRQIKDTQDLAVAFIKILEKTELSPTDANKKILADLVQDYEIVLLKLRHHCTNFPSVQRKIARAIAQFTQGLRDHYRRVHRSMDTTLGLLDERIQLQLRMQHPESTSSTNPET